MSVTAIRHGTAGVTSPSVGVRAAGRLSFSFRGRRLGGLPQTGNSGEWHHVALTCEQGRIFIDGQQVASRQWDGSLAGTLEGARIILGSVPQTTPCEFAVDTIRISDIARKTPPDPAPELPSDEHTLLRDGSEGLAATGQGTLRRRATGAGRGT